MRTSLVLGVATALMVGGGFTAAQLHDGSQPRSPAVPAGHDSSSPVDPSASVADTTPGDLCDSPAVVAFRVRWPDVPALTTPRMAAISWVEAGHLRLTASGDEEHSWAVIRALHQPWPERVLALELIGDAWFVTRTYACAELRPAASTRPCTSRLNFGNRPYVPARDGEKGTQVGVGRPFEDQASVTGCFRTDGGRNAVLRAPAWPVTAYQEEEVPPEQAVVISVDGLGPRTYVAVSGEEGVGARGAGEAREAARPRR